MRKSIILTFFWCFYFSLHSQFLSDNSAIGVSFSGLGYNDAFHLVALEGDGTFWGKGFYSFGITYIYPLSKKFDLETGVEYSKNAYHFSGPYYPGLNESYDAFLSLIEIPVTARFNFWHFFFLNGGLLVDFDVSKDKYLDNQTGIGAILGVGAKYNFKKIPIGLFINPFVKFRPLIPFTKEKYHLHTMDNGFRISAVRIF
ncbi:MAG: hypothetical protein FWH18_06575 [Marinilabiliaceae bacterium]|nr:hypothetical protein [Marinilabiliaceae bacterium]